MCRSCGDSCCGGGCCSTTGKILSKTAEWGLWAVNGVATGAHRAAGDLTRRAQSFHPRAAISQQMMQLLTAAGGIVAVVHAAGGMEGVPGNGWADDASAATADWLSGQQDSFEASGNPAQTALYFSMLWEASGLGALTTSGVEYLVSLATRDKRGMVLKIDEETHALKRQRAKLDPRGEVLGLMDGRGRDSEGEYSYGPDV